jgi:hypothetical protein
MLVSPQDVVGHLPYSRCGVPRLASCPLLGIQYINTYPVYIEAIYTIPILRTRHCMVTRDLLNVDFKICDTIIYSFLLISVFIRGNSECACAHNFHKSCQIMQST